MQHPLKRSQLQRGTLTLPLSPSLPPSLSRTPQLPPASTWRALRRLSSEAGARFLINLKLSGAALLPSVLSEAYFTYFSIVLIEKRPMHQDPVSRHTAKTHKTTHTLGGDLGFTTKLYTTAIRELGSRIIAFELGNEVSTRLHTHNKVERHTNMHTALFQMCVCTHTG